jgi:hypothetical protein
LGKVHQLASDSPAASLWLNNEILKLCLVEDNVPEYCPLDMFLILCASVGNGDAKLI